MDQLVLYQTFVRVVERGSFSAVARDLKTSQPVISRHIAALEDRLRVRLIQRTTRRLHLTDDGHRFFEHAVAAVSSMEAAGACLSCDQHPPSGRVRLGVPTYLGLRLLARLPEFLAHHPGISIDLKMQDRPFDVIEERLDFAIAPIQGSQMSLVTKVIGTAASVAVTSPGYLAARGTPASPQDLGDHDCIMVSPAGADEPWRFSRDGTEEPVMLHGRITVDSVEAALRAASWGLGIALLPRLAVFDDIEAGRLVTIIDNYRPIGLKLYAIMPSRRYVSARTRVTLDFLMAALRLGAEA